MRTIARRATELENKIWFNQSLLFVKISSSMGAKMFKSTRMIAVLPTNNLKTSVEFYGLLGLVPKDDEFYEEYQILIDGYGGELHLTRAPEGWLIPDKNPCGVYFYSENVDELAIKMGKYALHPPRKTQWGTYEFTASDPDENLVRVGRSGGE